MKMLIFEIEIEKSDDIFSVNYVDLFMYFRKRN